LGAKRQIGAEPGAPAHGRDERRAVPRGVIVLGLLLYTIAFISVAVALFIPAVGLPRWILLLYGLATATLATGLFRRRRWAWFSMLAFVLVNGYYLLLGTAQRGQNTAVGLTVLAVIAAYLLWPGVRGAYLEQQPRREV